MRDVCWRGVSHTELGQVRSVNEDSVFDNDVEQLWAVSDGMGGHNCGDYASQWVVEQLANYRKSPQTGGSLPTLRKILEQSNQHLVDKATVERAGIIGCTVAILSIHGAQVICSWSGDSRIYRYRGGQLLQLTRDHSLQSQTEDRDLIQCPEAPEINGELLTNAIGGESELHVEHCMYSLHQADKFLICTDGLYKEVSDDEIKKILASSTDASDVLAKLSTLYNSRGARDNMGLVYVFGSEI